MTNLVHQVVAVGAMAFAVAAAVIGQRGSGGTASLDWHAAVEAGTDHVSSAELAERLLADPESLVLIDVRPREEFDRLHLPGALNLTLPELLGPQGRALLTDAPDALVVLYSNGMTHPGQAWVELARAGFANVRVLEEGLDGFLRNELMPASLAAGAGASSPGRRAALRALVLGGEPLQSTAEPPRHAVLATDPPALGAPTIVSTDWVAARGDAIVLLDAREKSESFLAGHLPGARFAPVASLRATRDGVDDELLPAPALARRFGELGIDGETSVVVYADEKLQDATQVVLALVALGHQRVAVMEGGLSAWTAQGRSLSEEARQPAAKVYVPRLERAPFAVELGQVAEASRARSATILDVRPADAFRGEKVTEARGGHIPGSCNRPYTEDVVTDAGTWWKPREELERAYGELGFGKDQEIILTCRTGHQASLTWFTLRYVLGYERVRWYDGSFKEWAARSELPVATGEGHKP